jgi:uncharacterized repeat protein (TIGR01451 family)
MRKHIIIVLIAPVLSLVLATAVLAAARLSSEKKQSMARTLPSRPVTVPDEQPLSPSSISFEKTVGTDSSVCATTDVIDIIEGTAVTYCYRVKNGGPTTLTLHDLVDSELGVILNGFPYSLAAGASIFLTQTTTIFTDTVNMATWTGYNPGPTDVFSATDSASVNVLLPEISLNKTVGINPSACAVTDSVRVDPGTSVTYCYEVTNTGPITLTLHDLVDSDLSTILSDFPYSLNPGASAFLTQTTTILTTTVNTATWTASVPDQKLVATDSDTAVVDIFEADLEISKTASASMVRPGDLVTYTLTVMNHGPDIAMSVTLDDGLSTGLAIMGIDPGTPTCNLSGAKTASCTWASIESGGSVHVILQALVEPGAEGTVANMASVTSGTTDPDESNNSTSAVSTVSEFTIYLPMVLKQ